MEAKLKALKVADLKDILSKSGTPIGSKATKADLIAKILATPAALTQAGGEAPVPPAAAPAPADDDLLAPPDEFDWEAESGEKKDEGVKPAEAPAAAPAETPAPVPATTEPAASTTEPAAATTEPASTTEAATTETEAKPADDDDVARRKARAARFGIPFVENPQPTTRKREKAKKEDKPKEDKPKEDKPKEEKDKPAEKKDKPVEKKDKPATEKKDKPMRISAKEAAPNDDDAKLAARAARFGISTTAATTSTAKADADPAEEEKRKKREARFGAPAAKKPKTDT